MLPELSIIIVHYKTPELLALCLDSVKKHAPAIAYEVIIIDSAATSESKMTILEYGKSFSHFFYEGHKTNLGYSRGVNRGLYLARGRYMLIINPDTIVTESAIATLMEYLKVHPDVGLIGPQLRYFNDDWQQSYFRFYKPLTVIARRTALGRLPAAKRIQEEFIMDGSDHARIQTPDWILGAAMMTHRQALEKVGPMDERFFLYFEDVDWARRFWHNGYTVVYLPSAFFYHYYARESKSTFWLFDALYNQKARWHIQSAIKFFLKYRILRQTR